MLAHWTLTKYCFCFGAIKTKQNKQKTVLMVLEKPNEMPEMEPRLVVLQGKKLTRKNKAVLSSPNQVLFLKQSERQTLKTNKSLMK